MNGSRYQIFDVTGTRLVPVARSATHVNHDLLALKPYHVDRHPFLREYLANT